ncbi:hypothetical protein AAMO2058_001753200 [Amorphochlora amoebiformis]
MNYFGIQGQRRIIKLWFYCLVVASVVLRLRSRICCEVGKASKGGPGDRSKVLRKKTYLPTKGSHPRYRTLTPHKGKPGSKKRLKKRWENRKKKAKKSLRNKRLARSLRMNPEDVDTCEGDIKITSTFQAPTKGKGKTVAKILDDASQKVKEKIRQEMSPRLREIDELFSNAKDACQVSMHIDSSDLHLIPKRLLLRIYNFLITAPAGYAFRPPRNLQKQSPAPSNPKKQVDVVMQEGEKGMAASLTQQEAEELNRVVKTAIKKFYLPRNFLHRAKNLLHEITVQNQKETASNPKEGIIDMRVEKSENIKKAPINTPKSTLETTTVRNKFDNPALIGRPPKPEVERSNDLTKRGKRKRKRPVRPYKLKGLLEYLMDDTENPDSDGSSPYRISKPEIREKGKTESVPADIEEKRRAKIAKAKRLLGVDSLPERFEKGLYFLEKKNPRK